MVVRRLKVNSVSYRLGVRTLGGESISPVSNSDAISRSRATHCFHRKTACSEGVGPVQKVADGPRENANDTPNDHVFFVVALSKDIISLALKGAVEEATHIILNTGDGNPCGKG